MPLPHFQIRISQFDPALHNKLVCTKTHAIGVQQEATGKAKKPHPISITKTSHLQIQQTGTIAFQGAEWAYTIRFTDIEGHPGSLDVLLHMEVSKGQAGHCNIAFECVFDYWSAENYLLMPAAAYNGNRFESRRIAYSPKLLDPRDIGPDIPPIISDVPRLNIHEGPSEIHDRSGAMTTPSAGFFAPQTQQGFWLLTPQSTKLGDYGYKVTETKNRQQAILSVSAPVVREQYQYRITDNQYPSVDAAPNWQEGDSLEMRISLFFFACPDIQTLFDYWNDIRYHLIARPATLMSLPFSSTFAIQQEKFNRQNWVDQHGYYSVGMREMFLQDWQIGWTGGMISTYPLLFFGDDTTRQRVLRNFDFLFPKGISPSGFFWDCGETVQEEPFLESDTLNVMAEEAVAGKETLNPLGGTKSQSHFKWYGGDIRKPHTASWHLIRKSADALYFIIKQLQLMKATDVQVKPEWEAGTRRVAEAFVKLWNTQGQFGQFVDAHTGKVVVGGSTSAGIAPAALALAAEYFQNPDYLSVAEEAAASYYQQYVCKGLAMGGPGDALQNPDSESAYGLLESFVLLYEHTGRKVWLDRAEAMASQFATWVMGYDYAFPENCTLKQLGVRTRGAVFANTQNKHGSPGICTHSGVALLRLFRATGKLKYLELLRDIARFIPQMLSHPTKKIEGMPIGWMTERVSTTDWFEGIGELMYGSTWAETALMLTAAEIPAVYVIPEQGLVFAIDALEAKLVGEANKPARLWLKNPSGEAITARILAETTAEQAKPMGENHLLRCHLVRLHAGEELTVTL